MTRTKRELFLNNKGKRIVFVLLAFFLTYLISYLIDPFASTWQQYFERSIIEILEDVVLTLVCGVLISESSIFISKRLNGNIRWIERPVKRLLIETALNVLVALIVNFLVAVFYIFFLNDSLSSFIGPDLSGDGTKGTIHWLVVSIAIAFTIMGINTGNYLILNWKNAALRAAELNQVVMETELQALKLQIDPHFVFNNLSVLSELILEDQRLGYEYAENFSRIYRYMLINAKKDVTLLEDELEFLKSYIFLIQQRFGEGVRFEINVENASRYHIIPPMTLQLLVENALKHNRTTKKEPLTVSIFSTGNAELVVRNNLLPIGRPIDSSGIGLANVNRRYELLSDKQLKINNDGNYFSVILPLLKV